MTPVMSECNADLDHPCDGGEDGEPCRACIVWMAREEAHFKRLYAAASPEEKDPKKYLREMIDASRWYLL